ncbi:uncharacterized protein N7511_007070 [Penicillium nucicola]|uniref:uncharacterized protein n=1 Tax=Penicillium nucicola TaxID=1850975 RepID=UPI0025452891|nr:uncharacterized protein N7511_007070 [Penicillium nucicola]KAJ5756888.1 hypothetical protein N7511_007070 [Penicillium nucicola]
MIDGYDVVFQLPADVLIERYFAVINAANAKIAARFGADTIEGLTGANAPRQTILFGPEKICYPVDWSRPGCWAAPDDLDIPVGAFGPNDGELDHNQARWLNSGTIMGPVGDMRKMFSATMKRINATYDPAHEYSDSDQRYLSDVWGEQEYWRSIARHELYFHDGANATDRPPAGDPGPVPRVIPTRVRGQQTEFHIGIDYRSQLFQTRVGSDQVIEHVAFDRPTNEKTDLATFVTNNTIQSPNFKPYHIKLPKNVVFSTTRILHSISEILEGKPEDLISTIRFGTNFVTKNVYGMFHCIGEKTYLDDLWYRLWFQRYAQPLFEAAIRTIKEGKKISDTPIDGRRWEVAHEYPKTSEMDLQAGGVWADFDGEWLSWGELCQPFEGDLFGAKP